MGKSLHACIVFAIVCFAGNVAARNTSHTYRVVGVSDGDTLTALGAKRQRLKCRLHGIDAPEKKQSFGQASKLSLSELSFGRTVQITVMGHDRYGRSLCKIAVGGIDVNREQIARGMAWMYRQYTDDFEYSLAETIARNRRIGIWRDPQPVPPWAFRKHARNKSA